MKQCSCGQNIEFVRLSSGRTAPVEADGYVTVVTDAGETVRGRVAHFTTCPDAGAFRRDRIRQAERGAGPEQKPAW